MGFDPIMPDDYEIRMNKLAAGMLAGRLISGLMSQPKMRIPYIGSLPDLRTQFAPEQVIDPCPPLARMPRSRFSNRPTREF